MTKTIIFDYDGTIHHTLGIYEPAFRETYQWLTEQKVMIEPGYELWNKMGIYQRHITDYEQTPIIENSLTNHNCSGE